jgi:hypothetical protein
MAESSTILIGLWTHKDWVLNRCIFLKIAINSVKISHVSVHHIVILGKVISLDNRIH